MEHQQQHGISACLGSGSSLLSHRGAVVCGCDELVQKLNTAGLHLKEIITGIPWNNVWKKPYE